MRKNSIQIVFISGFVIFTIASFIAGYQPGKEIFNGATQFLMGMLKVLPCAFILIGLFEVWIKKTTVQKHLSGIKGIMFSILLASVTIGGIFVALPISYSLLKKGAKLNIVFTYIFASAVCRIPMTIFEASFLGVKFTLIRLITTFPLIIIFSLLLGKYIKKPKSMNMFEGNSKHKTIK